MGSIYLRIKEGSGGEVLWHVFKQKGKEKRKDDHVDNRYNKVFKRLKEGSFRCGWYQKIC